MTNSRSKDLPQTVFDRLTKLVPFVALEIVVVNKAGKILLTWRDDKYWRGWHFPGGLLRFRESFEQRLQETAQRELGTRFNSLRFLFPINYTTGRRSHDVSLVFFCKTARPPKFGKFFAKIPKDIIREHRELWRKVKKVLGK